MGYTDSEETILRTYMYCGCSLSLAGSAFILLVFILFRKLRIFSFQMILFMAACDSVKCIGYLLPTEGTACVVQGIFSQVGALSNALWAAVIANAIYQVVVKERMDIEALKYRYHGFVWGVTAVLSIVPGATESYGHSLGWCWIEIDSDRYILGNILRFGCFYFPLLLCILYSLYCFLLVIHKLKTKYATDSSQEEMVKTIVNRLKYYPLVLIVCYAGVFIKRVYNFISPESDDWPYAMVGAVGLCLVGFLDSLVYGFTPNVKEAIVDCCASHDVSDGESEISIAENQKYTLINP